MAGAYHEGRRLTANARKEKILNVSHWAVTSEEVSFQ